MGEKQKRTKRPKAAGAAVETRHSSLATRPSRPPAASGRELQTATTAVCATRAGSDSKLETMMTGTGQNAARFRLMPYQQRWVRDNARLKIAVKARQIGYSFAATLRAVLECLERRTTWLLLSKGERQSRLLMEKVHGHIQACGAVAESVESNFFEGTSLRQLEARFPNGSVIYGLPANPDTARGYSANVTLDEFAFHGDAGKIYAALFPSVTRGYQLEVISTPNGQQGKFYELARAAGLVEGGLGAGGWGLENGNSPVSSPQSPVPSRWSAHWCDIYEAAREGLEINIPMLHAGCEDESAWQQEFCCSFVSAEENFFSPELLAKCLSAEASAEWQVLGARGWGLAEKDSSVPSPQSPVPSPEFFMGIDVGRKHDRTVFWVDEMRGLETGDWRLEGAPPDSPHFAYSSASPQPPAPSPQVSVARMVRTLENTTFAGQLELARHLMSLKRPDGQHLIRRAAIDATGIGAMLAETLETEFAPRIESVTFTAAVKEDLAYRTRRRMESGQSLLPDTREVRRAFSAVKKFVTASGNVRLDAARTDAGHADEFWAKTLADLAASSRPVPQASQAFLGPAGIVNPMAFVEARRGWAELL